MALAGGNPDSPEEALAACAFPDSLLADPELRSEACGGLASRVSVHPAVRAALFQRQRTFASQPGGAVLDGRDIGTVLAPEATAKLFVIASVEARAQRRFAEMQGQGREVSLAEIEADLAERDLRDRTRAEAPLRAAEDAVVLDNSAMGKDESVAAAIAIVEAAKSRKDRKEMRGDHPLALPNLSCIAHHLDLAPCREAALTSAAPSPCARPNPRRHADRYGSARG